MQILAPSYTTSKARCRASARVSRSCLIRARARPQRWSRCPRSKRCQQLRSRSTTAHAGGAGKRFPYRQPAQASSFVRLPVGVLPPSTVQGGRQSGSAYERARQRRRRRCRFALSNEPRPRCGCRSARRGILVDGVADVRCRRIHDKQRPRIAPGALCVATLSPASQWLNEHHPTVRANSTAYRSCRDVSIYICPPQLVCTSRKSCFCARNSPIILSPG
jgi:hypothetical protein